MANVTIIENHDYQDENRVRVHGSNCKDVAKDKLGANFVSTIDAGSQQEVLERIADDNCEDVEDITAKFLPCCKF